MADDPSTQSSQRKTLSAKVTYDMGNAPIYGCDHAIIVKIQDGTTILQLFSTAPPVVNEEDGSFLTPATRRCVGQFQLSPTLVRRMSTMLQRHLSKEEQE